MLPKTKQWRPLMVLGLLFGVSAGVFLWLIDYKVAAREPAGFYGYQTEAFLAGQLHLKLVPHPRLAELANPYEGDQNREYRVLDLSYYQGKYYSYFGVGPVLFLTLPWRVLTGTYLTEPGATLVLALATGVVNLILLRRLRQVLYPSVPDWAVVAAYAVMVLGNFTTIHLVGVNPGTVAQQGAYLWLSGSFIFLLGGIEAAGRARGLRSLMQASACCGMAVACRPSFLPIIGMMAPVVVYLWDYGRRAGAIRLLLAAAGPFGVIVAALLAYNYARFDSLFEFGNRLQLTDVDYRQVRLLTGEFVWERCRDFLIHPFGVAHYFPFISNRHDLVPVGLIWTSPLSVLSLGFLLAWRTRTSWRHMATAMEMGMLIAFAGIFLLLACYRLFLFHYQVDFIVLWTVVAVLGWFAALERLAGNRRAVFWLGAAGCSLCAASMVVALLYTVALTDTASTLPRLTRAMNGLVETWDRVRGVMHGPVRLTVRFSSAAAGQTLPLVLTGKDNLDLCYVKVGLDSTVQVGLFHTGAGGPLSEPVLVDLAAPQQFEISMGSLLPERRHPLFDGYDEDAVRRAKAIFKVSLNGKRLVMASADYFPSSPDSTWIGETPTPVGNGAATKFAGEILAIERLTFQADWLEGFPVVTTGAATIRFRLPPGGRTIGVEPILSTGESGRGDVVFIRYLPDSKVVFGVDHWGGGAVHTEPLKLDDREPHSLSIVSNGLAAAGHEQDVFGLVLDGEMILSQKLRAHASSSSRVFWGLNASRSSMCERMFSGTILQVAAVDPARFAKADPVEQLNQPGTLVFQVRFQLAGIGQSQPLVVTGEPGKADFLYVILESPNRLRFGFDHWGVGGMQSEPVEFDLSRQHELAVDFGSIHALPGGRSDLAGAYQVMLDGRVVFTGSATFHPATLDNVTIGSNLVGGSTTGARLLGRITDLHVRSAGVSH